MTAATLKIKDAELAQRLLAAEEVAGVLTPYHHDADRPALLAAIAAIVTALQTVDGHVDGLEGLATALNGYVDGLETAVGTSNTALASILAKLIAAPATEVKQDATNTALATLNGYVDGVEGLLTSLLAKVIAAPATEAKQDALKTSIDALAAAIKPATGHFLVVPAGTALANPTRRIVCNAAGALTCTVGGVAVSYAVSAGQQIDVVATIISAAPAGTVGQY